MPFMSLIFWTVVPNAFAMSDSVSPDWTVYS